MDVKLYNTNDEQNVIGKQKTLIDTASCVIKGNISYENPVVLLAYDGDVADSINYMEIPELNRFYFITDMLNLTGGRYEIHAKVDVLESFKAAIKALTVIIDKTENDVIANKYLNDGSFVSMEKEIVTCKNFSTGFLDDGEFILITAGGIAAT